MVHLLHLALAALEVLAGYEVRNVLIVVILLITALLRLLHALVALGQLAQRGEAVRAELVENAGDQLREFLVFAVAVKRKGVRRDRGVDCSRMSMTVAAGEGKRHYGTFRCRKVDHVAVALEHVDLLDRLDGLHVELLERALQLLVVGSAGLVDLLDLASWCSLASVS